MCDRIVLNTSAQMIIHLAPDDSDCETYKPRLRCSCGMYDVEWSPPPTSSIWHLWARWWIEGLVDKMPSFARRGDDAR